MKVVKKYLISLLLSAIALQANAQHEVEAFENKHRNSNAMCDTRVEIADSTVNFLFNPQYGTLTPVSVLLFSYDDNLNLTTVISKSLPERTNKFRQIFTFDHNDNISRYVYQLWVDDKWKDNLINERTYTPEGLPDTEVFLRENSSGQFVPYQRHFFITEEGRTTSYLRQVKDAAGNWYDFSYHHYVYDDEGRLTVLYGQYINSGLIFWERTAVYNEEGRIAERYLKVLRYNYALKQNVLINELYEVSSYNKYGNVVERRNHGFADNEWYFSNLDSIYYSKLPGNRKVSICHNGNTICVSINALDAHLAHGDKIGSCKEEKDFRIKDPEEEAVGSDEESFSIYPNPATSKITVTVDTKDKEYTSGHIMSSDGRILRSFQINGQRETEVNVSSLRPGRYLVTIAGKRITDTGILIIE